MSLRFLTLSFILIITATASPFALPDNAPAVGTSSSPNVQKPAPPPTPWKIEVTVGSTPFAIGDASDPSILKNLVQSGCNITAGCDRGTPQSFTFNSLDSSRHSEKTPGQIVMSGNWDSDNADIGKALVVAVQNTLAKTISCQTESYTSCLLKREGVGIALGCGPSTIQQCTAVNFLQAVAYDPTGNQKGQVTMDGSSSNANGFDCHTFTDTFSAGFGILAVGAPELGGVGPILTLICDIV